MNIDQFISQLESSDAYRNNGEVRKLVSEHRQALIDLAHGDDGEAFKAELMKFNDRLDIALKPSAVPSAGSAPEASELIEKLGLLKQYRERLKTLGLYGFIGKQGETKKGDVPRPTFEKAMAVFTPEMLELATTFQEPTLLLVPETSFAAKVAAIDAHKTMEDQVGTIVVDLYTEFDSGSEKIKGWKVVIVEGAKEMKLKEGDDVKLELKERIENRKSARKPRERGIGRHAYALLMMESLRKGEPIDKGAFTLLVDDPDLTAYDAPYARWDDGNGQVVFYSDDSEAENDRARFRSSVGSEVPLSATESSETVEKFNLEREYHKRVLTLDAFGFINVKVAKGSDIKGVDGLPYRIPTLSQIKARLTPEKMKLIEKHIKNPMLLVVPFAMPLRTIAEKVGQNIGTLDQNPIYTKNYDIDSDLPDRAVDEEQLVYFPEKFDKSPYGGLTKSEILSDPESPFPGWLVLVVDGTETTPEDTRNKSAIDLKAEFDAAGLSGLTPEEWLLLHAEGAFSGKPFDDWKKNSQTWNLASYLKKADSVPASNWFPGDSQVYLGLLWPYGSDGDLGSRRAVRL